MLSGFIGPGFAYSLALQTGQVPTLAQGRGEAISPQPGTYAVGRRRQESPQWAACPTGVTMSPAKSHLMVLDVVLSLSGHSISASILESTSQGPCLSAEQRIQLATLFHPLPEKAPSLSF